MTIFEKIVARQTPAKIIWEDEDAVAFHDVNPQAPVHVLIVPKKVIPRLTDATDDDRALLGKLLLVARDLGAVQAQSQCAEDSRRCSTAGSRRAKNIALRTRRLKAVEFVERLVTNKRPIDPDGAFVQKAL